MRFNFLSKNEKKIQLYFFQFLVIKTLDPHPDPDSLEMSGSVTGSEFNESGSTTLNNGQIQTGPEDRFLHDVDDDLLIIAQVST